MQTEGQYLSRLHRACLESAATLKFDKTHAWHFTLVALYGSVIELTGCVIVLTRHDGHSGLGALVRALLEAYIDLAILVDDPSYGRVMDAADAKQLRVIYRRAQETDNPYLMGVREHPDFPKEVARLDGEIAELEAAGVRPIAIEQRFQRAGATDLYDGVYRLLCTDTHSNRSALIGRHLDVLEGGDFGVALYKPREAKELRPFLDSSAGMLVDATRRVFSALEIEMPQALPPVLDELAAIREQQLGGADSGA